MPSRIFIVQALLIGFVLVGCGGSNLSQLPPVRPMVSVSGRITDASSGERLGGALVKVRDYPTRRDLSAVDGSFLLRMVPTGRQIVLVTLFGYDPYETVVELEPNLDLTLTVAMVPQRGALLGYVFDETGNPLGGARVTVGGLFVSTTSDDGRFSFVELPVGGHLIVVEKTGYLPHTGSVTIAKGEYAVLEITLLFPLGGGTGNN
ncbi:MAG TPA: carboxypeptidase-like regulatory domain-containing protein [Atribacteraceae bacterium]|nr:carboxypeptidase-like regulatory domain-containing protein [Atribacteraceae bacterium]